MQMPCIVMQQGIGLISLFHYFCIYVAVLHCCNVASTVTCTFLHSHIIYFIGLISLFQYFCIYVAVLHCCNVALLPVLSFILI